MSTLFRISVLSIIYLHLSPNLGGAVRPFSKFCALASLGLFPSWRSVRPAGICMLPSLYMGPPAWVVMFALSGFVCFQFFSCVSQVGKWCSLGRCLNSKNQRVQWTDCLSPIVWGLSWFCSCLASEGPGERAFWRVSLGCFWLCQSHSHGPKWSNPT